MSPPQALTWGQGPAPLCPEPHGLCVFTKRVVLGWLGHWHCAVIILVSGPLSACESHACLSASRGAFVSVAVHCVLPRVEM